MSSGFLAELKRRRVFRVAAAYAVVAWIVIQVAVSVFPVLHLPTWTATFVVIIALLGFPVALVLAWAFQITPEGVKRSERPAAPLPGTARRFDPRTAGWIGVGIVTGLVTVGAYGWVGARGASTGAPAPEDRSIAVLPFTNMSEIADNEYFSDGMTEDILTQLALVKDLSVVSRTSVMKYKGTTLSIPEIGRELGVSYILEGSVRRAGNRVLVTAQLIDARADEHVWADNYDRDLTDIFAVQAEVSAAIARELQASLTPGERERIEASPTDNMVAYDLVLRAREMIGQSTAQNESAIELLKEAIRLDPDYSDAYSALAGAYMQRVQIFGFPTEWADSGVSLARRSIQLDPGHARAYSSLGANLVQLGRNREAREAYERALELNPSFSTALNNLAALEARQGNWELSFPLLFRAQKIDPRSSHPALNLATGYAALGDTAASSRWLSRAEELGHPTTVTRALRAVMLMRQGQPAAASRSMEAMLAENPGDFIARYAVLWLSAMSGDWERAREISGSLHAAAPQARPGDELSIRYLHGVALWHTREREEAAEIFSRVVAEAEAVRADGEEVPAAAYEAGAALALQGRRDEALAWLQRAHSWGFKGSHDLAADRSLESLRGDPEFERIRRQVDGEVRALAERVSRLEPER